MCKSYAHLVTHDLHGCALIILHLTIFGCASGPPHALCIVADAQSASQERRQHLAMTAGAVRSAAHQLPLAVVLDAAADHHHHHLVHIADLSQYHYQHDH